MTGLHIVQIDATTLPDAWYQTMYAAIALGRKFKIDRGSYAGQWRLEFDFAVIHIRQPGIDPVIPTMPESSPIPPPVDAAYLDDYLPYMMENQPPKLNESYTYGQRMRAAEVDPHMAGERLDRPKVYLDPPEWIPPMVDVAPRDKKMAFPPLLLDQLELLIHTYKTHGPRNNQMCLQVAQPTDMLLRDPPCCRHIDSRIQDGALHFFPYFRSWDLFGGFPANLAAIELMKRYCASEIGVGNGEIIASSKGLHLYDHAWGLAESLGNKTIKADRTGVT